MTAEANSRLGQIQWISEPARRPDFDGPTELAYEPLPRDCELGFEVVERVAGRHPDKVAVWDGELSLTYAELLDRAYGLAERIAAAVPPGGAISSIIHNGPAATATLLAVFGSGRTYVPIDASHPPERQKAILAEAGAAAVIVEAGAENALGALPDTAVIVFDARRPSGAARFPEPKAGKAARLVTFTSGSTGTPKGLALGAPKQLIADFIDRYHLNADDVFASLASMSQTGAADLVALTVGASIRVIDMRRIGIAESLKAFREAGITFLSFVPSALRAFMMMPGVEQIFAALRVLNLHGERILTSDLALFRSKLPPACRISITYGTTETGAVFSWFYRAEAAREDAAPVGYIMSGKQVAVLGEDGHSVRQGETGELIVRGEIALGSWQKGRLTSARFLPDPDDPAARIYVTGDLVFQREDGLFQFVGRKDRQVKVRGLIVDLSEVESALRAAEGVDDAVAIVRSTPGQADEIAAFVTAVVPETAPDLPGLRRTVAAATAEHMAPSIIRVLPAIPRLANHKPDLVALQAMIAG